MTALRVTRLLLVACALELSIPATVSAWGPDGHRIVCRIAYQLLDAPRQDELRRLTAAYSTPDGRSVRYFTDGCNFADEARSRARDEEPDWLKFAGFDNWHFLNAPRRTLLVSEAHCAGDCLLTGLTRHTASLAAVTDAQRAEALFFLGHWAGDIHQPLHVSYDDDLGGNSIKPISGGFYPATTNLHQVWDSGIITRAIGSEGWRPYADRLAREISPAEHASWLREGPLEWAQESYNLATSAKARYCVWSDGGPACGRLGSKRTLGEAYQDEFQDDVERRLQQAGARLSELLRRHLVIP